MCRDDQDDQDQDQDQGQDQGQDQDQDQEISRGQEKSLIHPQGCMIRKYTPMAFCIVSVC